MMAVNLGTRGTQEAADLLEYCNVAGKPIGATYRWTGQICCSHSKWRCIPSVHTVISKRGGSTIRRFVEDSAYSDDLFADVSG